VVKIKNYQA